MPQEYGVCGFAVLICCIQGSAVPNLNSISARSRPLLVTAGRMKDLVRLETGQAHKKTRTLTKVPENQLYVVRSDMQQRHVVMSSLTNLSHFVQYLPHDSFIVTLKRDLIDSIVDIEGVHDIFILPPTMKVANDLANFLDEESNISESRRNSVQEPDSSGNIKLNVLIAGNMNQNDIQAICGNTGNPIYCRITASSTKEKIVIETNEECISKVVQRLAQHPLVRWVEERRPIHLNNKYASGLIQGTDSVDISSRQFWASGLFGDDEIIGTPPIPLMPCATPREFIDEKERLQASRTRASTPTRASSTTPTSRCPTARATAT
jgi:hypothetical protein